MARLLILATIILSIVSFASAQIVNTLNTPPGPIAQGATVSVTWTLNPGVDATGKTGSLTAQDMNTKNTITINSSVPLAPSSFSWTVDVPVGTYTLGLNDGSGPKQSGPVQVGPSANGTTPAPGTPPAASTPAASTPAASTPAASTPASSTPASSTPAASTPQSPTTGSSTASTSSSAPEGSTSNTLKKSSSASSIFSGYDVIFSLLGVAIAMIQF